MFGSVVDFSRCFRGFRMKALLQDPARLFEIGKTLQHNGRWVDAIDVLSLASELAPGDPAIRFQRALCMLACGFFNQGWTDYELRLHDHPLARHLGGAGKGREEHLIVHGEQGIGDEIMFASLFGDLYSERMSSFSVIADLRLHNLFSYSFPHLRISDVDSRQSKEISLTENERLLMIGSLARGYRPIPVAFPGTPYLLPDPSRLEFFRSVTHNRKGLAVGLAWRGGLIETRRHLRSIPFVEWDPVLAAFPQNTYYSLQHDEFQAEKFCQWQATGNVFNISGKMFDDWLELASFICSLDLVITVQSSIVHLCGALGISCWALISAAPEWRYGIAGESMPWYRSVKLYRQARLGDWAPVLNRVKNDLTQKIEERK